MLGLKRNSETLIREGVGKFESTATQYCMRVWKRKSSSIILNVLRNERQDFLLLVRKLLVKNLVEKLATISTLYDLLSFMKHLLLIIWSVYHLQFVQGAE